MEGNEKKCIYCKKVLPLSDFYKNRDRPDGHDVLCKECRKALQRKKHATARQSYLASVPMQVIQDELRRRGALINPDGTLKK